MSVIRFFLPGQCLFLILPAFFLFACASTQLIEETPTELLSDNGQQDEQDDVASSEQPDNKVSPQPQGSAQAYPQDIVGAVSELYGEQAQNQFSNSYRQAVDTNPSLRYNIVYFDYDRAVVSPTGRQLLKEHAVYLQSNPEVRISIEGHTDERGSADYNIALGERRAKSVRTLLLAYGVTASNLSTISYGEERPALRGHTEQAYSKNRRVEIIYY